MEVYALRYLFRWTHIQHDRRLPKQREVLSADYQNITLVFTFLAQCLNYPNQTNKLQSHERKEFKKCRERIDVIRKP